MQHMASNEQPPYPYSQQQPHYASHMAQQEQIPQQQQRDQQDSYAQESEGDEYDHSGPPKKKRRRQALSCTGIFIPHSFFLSVTDFFFSHRLLPSPLSFDDIRFFIIS